jgi:hypothetical protein
MDNNLIYGGGLAAYLGLMILIGYLVKTESKLRKTTWLGPQFRPVLQLGHPGRLFSWRRDSDWGFRQNIFRGHMGRHIPFGRRADSYRRFPDVPVHGGHLLHAQALAPKFISLGDLFYTRFGGVRAFSPPC